MNFTMIYFYIIHNNPTFYMTSRFFYKFSCYRVDFNKDRSVSAKEMQRWIMEKTEEHFQEAVNENKNSFRAVDPDGDGESHALCRLYYYQILPNVSYSAKF